MHQIISQRIRIYSFMFYCLERQNWIGQSRSWIVGGGSPHWQGKSWMVHVYQSPTLMLPCQVTKLLLLNPLNTDSTHSLKMHSSACQKTSFQTPKNVFSIKGINASNVYVWTLKSRHLKNCFKLLFLNEIKIGVIWFSAFLFCRIHK